jgi:uncharacterized tellurite resistance protein B-like protein
VSKKDLVLNLAKLVAAAAWADGEPANDEVNALKDLLFRIEEVTTDDWTALNMYLESPPSEEERDELLGQVLSAIRTGKDKAFAIDTLEKLFASDGEVSGEEKDLLQRLKAGIEEVDTGIFAGFAKALKSTVGKRKAAAGASALREEEAEDYIYNRIYYDLKREVDDPPAAFGLPEGEVRKICLAAGLLAHVAHVDSKIAAGEQEAIGKIMSEDWKLSAKNGELLAAVSCGRTAAGIDYIRVSHGYFEVSTPDEREKFIATLFRVANAVGKTDNEEIEEIRRVANSLKVGHKKFINAKLTIPREDRKGL